MVNSKEDNYNLKFLTIGLMAGLLSAIAIIILADAYPVIQILVPQSIVDPSGIIYIALVVIGIFIFIHPCFSARKNLTAAGMFLSGFFILFGLVMIGIAH
jgi:hypothetical protein